MVSVKFRPSPCDFDGMVAHSLPELIPLLGAPLGSLGRARRNGPPFDFVRHPSGQSENREIVTGNAHPEIVVTLHRFAHGDFLLENRNPKSFCKEVIDLLAVIQPFVVSRNAGVRMELKGAFLA